MFAAILGIWLALQLTPTTFVVSTVEPCVTALASPGASDTFLADTSLPNQAVKHGCGRLLNNTLFVHWDGDSVFTEYPVEKYTFKKMFGN